MSKYLLVFLVMFSLVHEVHAGNSFTATKFSELGPVMTRVALCESGGQQFDKSGNVVKNVGAPVYGLFQIHAVHIPAARKLGLDIMQESDNIKFAMVLYKSQGLLPWISSASCWNRSGDLLSMVQ